MHVADIDEAAVTELVESHPNITGSVEDISVPETVDAWFADVERELGRLNVLVNNAGISGPTAPADEPCAGRFANRGGLRE